MSSVDGRFVWYELMTTDLGAARTFYDQVVGWQAMETQMPGHPYWMFTVDKAPIGGLMDLPQDARRMGAPPSWIGYVYASDVDAAAAKASALGGKLLVEPKDIPNVGRFAIVADPGGAVFGLLQSSQPEQVQAPEQAAPGRVGWHELYAGNLDAALAFYTGLFGWEKKDAMPMGEMGVYQIFGVGDAALGGMMTKPPMVPVAHWGYYFNVGNIDEAAERVRSAGGQIVMGPQEVPGGDLILQGVDPQGAHFALVGKR